MSSSDDDAPEELSLSAGKSLAVAQKQLERETSKRVTKKRSRNSKSANDDQLEGLDLLPEDVLAAVSAKSR
jgi:hypothetical protein